MNWVDMIGFITVSKYSILGVYASVSLLVLFYLSNVSNKLHLRLVAAFMWPFMLIAIISEEIDYDASRNK